MEKPNGHSFMNETEKAMIQQYRAQGYTFEQIARFMQRSTSSVKRVVYGWDQKATNHG